ALAMPMLGEAVPARQWMAILVGFYGVLVILRPGQVGMDFIAYAGMMAALAGSFTYAVTLVTARAIGQVESPAAVGFYPALTIAVASLAFLPGNFVVPSGTDLALLCLIGLMGGLSTILLNEAFRIAPSAYLAPLDYTAIIWALIIGLTVWGDVPDALTINGGALVVLSGLYVTRLSRDRASVKSA
ncbi:MAG: DMT family transporter, partial [Pseudomonadota bacterium]